MNNQKGFTLIELMAVVAIIGILATISLPIFNHYIEKSKAAAGLASLGTYKNDVAVCFMHEDDFERCDSGKEGIHEGVGEDEINWLEGVEVIDGSVFAALTATNHFTQAPHVIIELRPDADAKDAAMNWDIYCSDFAPQAETHLIDTCKGPLQGIGDSSDIIDDDSDGDSIEDGEEDDEDLISCSTFTTSPLPC